MDNYSIRVMNRQDMDLMIDWARLEDWNPGVNDAGCFHTADPNGFFIGELDGEPVGCISAVKYSKDFGFIGFYIVRPEFRGKGYGIKLWHTGMDYLKGCDIGLDGVPAQQCNYQKSGFKLHYSNVRYMGVSEGWEPRYTESLDSVAFDDLLKYDTHIFGVQRSTFLKAWINQPDSFGCCSVEHGKITGYGVLRLCDDGYKVGPLFADTPDVAQDILDSLLSNIGGLTFYLDVPEENTGGMIIAEEYGMTPVFGTARMYTGTKHHVLVDNVFGVTSFELG